MCLLIFIRISAATPCGLQTKLCYFTEILKAQKLKTSHRPSSTKIFYYYASLEHCIAEYNDRCLIEKKGQGVGFFPGKWMQIPQKEV